MEKASWSLNIAIQNQQWATQAFQYDLQESWTLPQTIYILSIGENILNLNQKLIESKHLLLILNLNFKLKMNKF